MKKIICKIRELPFRQKREVLKSNGVIIIEKQKYKCKYYFGRHNIYVQLLMEERIGIRLCISLTKKQVLNVVKIQRILNTAGFAPAVKFFEICSLSFEASNLFNIALILRKAFRKKRVVRACIFQEHLNSIREFDNIIDNENFLKFKNKIHKIAEKNGLLDRDVKKGNIIISDEGIKCIDFDTWEIIDLTKFSEINYES